MAISKEELKRIAQARLRDAQALLKAGRYDGAVYLCGYGVELALKARICRTLKWPSFPETNSEFQPFQSLKTHNLDTLLAFSGQEDRFRNNYSSAWSVVVTWNPEVRYRMEGTATQREAENMVNAVRELLRIL